MDFYKKIIRSKKLRIKILECLSVLPDDLTIKIQYKIKTGRNVDLKNPKRYTEKIQWYKLNYRTDLVTQCADKYAVREYVESKGLGFLLNDLYAVYDNADKIDFKSLPKQFAMKSNNSSGTNYFVTDKEKENFDELRKLAKGWISHKAKSLSGEWCYENIEPRIIFEKLLPKDKNNDLPDYKFFCFNGEPKCLYTITEAKDHDSGKLAYFDLNFNKMPYTRSDYDILDKDLEKPKNFDKMIEYAKILSQDFPHVRVDFYNVDGQIIFGELTFHNGSGYFNFNPDEFDFIMGDMFDLPEKTVI